MAAYDLLVKFTENRPEFSDIIFLMRKVSGLDINYKKEIIPLEGKEDAVFPFKHSTVNFVGYDVFVDTKLDHVVFSSYDEGYSIGYVPQMFKQHYLVGVSAAALKALGANLPFPLNENIIEKRWDEIRWKFRYY